MTAAGASRPLFEAGTLVIVIAGLSHFAGAVVDHVRPTFFTPLDDGLRSSMAAARGMRFFTMLPGQRLPRTTMWQLWVGFNMSHGLGIAAYGLVCFLLALHDYALVAATPGLLPLTVVIGALFLAISARCWLYGSTLLIVLSTACLAVAYLLV